MKYLHIIWINNKDRILMKIIRELLEKSYSVLDYESIERVDIIYKKHKGGENK